MFHHFVHSGAADGRLPGLLAALAETADAASTAAEVRAAILAADLPPACLEAVREAYRHVGAGRVAVRSSAADEDGSARSFAGIFESFLNVGTLDGVVESIKRCWASAFSDRAVSYLTQHQLPVSARMAVVVQRLVPADTSGVLFTANPAAPTDGRYVISSVYGLGEGLVTGEIDADTVTIEPATGRVVDVVTGEKTHRRDADTQGAGCVLTEVADAERAALSLSDTQLRQLTEVGARIAAIFAAPQDIEWAFSGERLWILQSRPITGGSPAPPAAHAVAGVAGNDGDLALWDNSSIVENFFEVTAPLTFTIANEAVHRMFAEYYRVLHFPRAARTEADGWLRAMLGYINGRVYFNLLNWYRMVEALPLARFNRVAMEISMGVEEQLDEATAALIRPFATLPRRQQMLTRTVVGVTYTWRFLTVGRAARRFLRDFYRVFEKFERIDYDALGPAETYRQFATLYDDLLPRWADVAMLDAATGLSFGTFRKLTQRWLPAAPAWLGWEAVQPPQGVESTEPAQALLELIELAGGDDVVRKIMGEVEPAGCREALSAAGAEEFLRRVDDYTRRYGYRTANELKLEEPSLNEHPASLFEMVRDGLAGASPAAPPVEQGERWDADAYLASQLPAGRRMVFGALRRKVQRLLVARERVRFARTRAFGLIRRILLALGRDLTALGALDAAGDIFWLRLDELRGCFEGTLAHRDLRSLVRLRKQDAAHYATLTAPPRFTTRGLVYWPAPTPTTPARSGQVAATELAAGTELSGTPAAPGIAEGEAQVMSEPRHAGGGVLVTYRADPGWVSALPSAAAVLIERGSPLTHIAVVARELGKPTVVQIRGLVASVSTGTRLRVDGGAGRVTVLPPD